MRSILPVAGAATLFLCALAVGQAKPPVSAKADQGSIVIVFKDGRQQSFKLADVARVEFAPPAAAAAVPGNNPPGSPSRAHFLGKWEVGDGSGGIFYITLEENGDAQRTLHSLHGRWAYVNGEAQITWDDGAKDAIRKVASKYQKYAFTKEKSFTDTPDNVTGARNLAPRPS